MSSSLFGSKEFFEIAGGLAFLILSFLLAYAMKLAKGKAAIESTLEAVRISLTKTYEEVIKPGIARASDPSSEGGVLITPEERKVIFEKAWAHLLSTGTPSVVAVLRTKGIEWLKVKAAEMFPQVFSVLGK